MNLANRFDGYLEKLFENLPVGIAVHIVKLTPDEKVISDCIFRAQRVLDSSFDPHRINWEEYNFIERHAREILTGYNGRFKEYFENKLKLQDAEERIVSGYAGSSL